MDALALPEHLASRREAMRTNTLIQVGCLVLAAGFLGGASLHQSFINRERENLQLVLSDELASAMPPDLAFLTTALGSFRGLAIDFLWIRGENLKQEGKYFEALQLSEWLCKLQPRFASVWIYHAWNMAYNISVGTYSPEQRWKWVYNGVKLLRDEGRKYNPKSTGVYRELAWILFHKIGDITDDYHPVYKAAWAGMFERTLGRPVVEQDRPEALEIFRLIAEAPTSLEALRASSPEAARYLDRLAEMNVPLYSPQIESLPLARDHSFLSAMCKYGPNGVLTTLSQYKASATAEPTDPKALIDLVQDPALLKGRDAVASYARATVLRDIFKMDPSFMLELMEEYGAMDWRCIYAHSLYWAKMGIRMTEDVRMPDTNNVINNFRTVFFSLASLFRQGNVVFEQDLDDPLKSYLHFQPSTRFVDALHKTYLTLGKLGPQEVEGRLKESQLNQDLDVPDKIYQVGHVNFLHDSISLLFLSGRQDDYEKAEYYYRYLGEHYQAGADSAKDLYFQPLEDFVYSLYAEQLEINKYTQAMIEQVIHGAFYELMVGRREGYGRRMKAAENFWRIYRQRIPDVDRHARQALPDIAEARKGVLEFMMAREPIDPILKIQLWQRLSADLALVQGTYDAITASELLKKQCQARGIDMTRAFPEPPGMAQYRERAKAERAAEQKEGEIEVGEGAKR